MNFNFGNYICELREARHLSQSELGRILGVTNKAVSKWENGAAYPSTELMLPLAQALGVTIEDLYRAISNSKMKRTKARIILDFLQSNELFINIICSALAMLPLLLYAIFSRSEEKVRILIITPIFCVVIYFIFRLSLLFARKNPFTSEKVLDIFCLFILLIMVLAYILMGVEMIKYFPDGFSPSICIPPVVFMSLVHIQKKRYK